MFTGFFESLSLISIN